jgi:hypothetical protein
VGGSARPDPPPAYWEIGVVQEAGLTFRASNLEATSARRRGDRRAECHGSHV